MIPDTASLWAGVRRFEDILKRDPQAYSFAPLADLYLCLGLIEDALQAARKGCALHPDFAAGHLALARAALESSLKAEAKKALESVVRITPENLEAQRLLADIYIADNETSDAMRCLGIVSSLEAVSQEPVIPVPVVAAALAEDAIFDEDILELTDDLIEAETIEDIPASPFSAAPERPSLGDVPLRAEPFLLETAPPFYNQDEPSMSQQPIETEDAVVPAVASATIAELYVSQGFPERGAEVYRDLLQGEPDNEVWKKRLAELTAPPIVTEHLEMSANIVAETSTGSLESVLKALGGWLANIGRIRECRSKNA